MAEIITAFVARTYWRALMGNVVSLIEDAALLLETSPARARSLLILALEETGKAQRLYMLASGAWSRALQTVELPDSFVRMERWHHPKIVASLDFGDELEQFWGDYTNVESFDSLGMAEVIEEMAAKRQGHESTARKINLQKQAGFYVDRTGNEVVSPQDTTDDIVADLQRTAGIAEMLLITDNSRMQMETPNRFDSTLPLQMRLLPFSHPEEYFAFEDSLSAPDDGD